MHQKWWYAAPVSMLGKTTGPKSWSPKMPTQAFMENQCSCLDDTDVWGLSSTQIWVLWKFTTPSLVNYALSVKRMLAKKCMFKTHFLEATGKTPPLHDAQEEWGLALAWCDKGKMTVHREFSRQGEHLHLQQLQFLANWFRDLLPIFSIHEIPHLSKN
jgi:hypothetical protein